jgi:hypothetical protein
MQLEIKIVTIVGKLVQDLGSNLGFSTITILLHDPGGDLCIFLELLIGPSFEKRSFLFVMFHIS